GQTLASIAQYQANIVNALAAFTGAQMHGAMVSTWGGGSGALVEVGPRLQYLQDDHDFELFEDTTGFVSWLHNVQHDDDLAPLVDAGVMTLLHKVHLEGGDPLERLAWANSQADNPSASALDLQVAQRRQ